MTKNNSYNLDSLLKESPFNLNNEEAYQRWREFKLCGYPLKIDTITQSIANPKQISLEEKSLILASCERYNFCIIKIDGGLAVKNDIKQVCRQLGLNQLDQNLCSDEESISKISDRKSSQLHNAYVPYSSKGLSWHTDGYYNSLDHTIRGMVLYCQSPAQSGGKNELMDFDMLYILLRDLNPDYIQALSAQNVMTIPANISDGKMIRPDQTGPVFSVDASTGHLHMRYSARKRNIVWREDIVTQEAVNAIEKVLNTGSDYIISYKPKAGCGVVSNNCLHNRSSFTDSKSGDHNRVIYRARFYDRVS